MNGLFFDLMENYVDLANSECKFFLKNQINSKTALKSTN